MKISICLTIHNKQAILREVLHRLYTFTDWGRTELVCVLDGCTDASEQILLEAIRAHSFKKIKTHVVYTENVFETKANNAAFKKCSGEYVVVLQDDQLINEYDWNLKMLIPFKAFDDVFAVTARCSHNWQFNENSIDIHSTENNTGRWSDILIHTDHSDTQTITDRNVFAVRASANRGPLIINREDLVKLNYLDEIYSPQEYCEHDLMFRARKQLKKVCGFYHIDWFSKPEYGGTRDEEGNTKKWLFEANQKNSRIFYERHKNDLVKIIENRIIK